ncbi:MAG: prepilin-type N-terminal cleavage/methylation domain-containing protein [Vicinamibacterales bacterium]
MNRAAGDGRVAGRGERGFTLIELTVVLAVIVTLALVLTPSVRDSINEARVARARNDCQTIASGLYQFYRDTGYFPVWKVSQNGGMGTPANRLQVLVSQGNVPVEDVVSLWTTGVAGSLADQLVTNGPGYTLRSATSPFGWNGPYFSSQLMADPWGNRYAVNAALIDLSPGAATASGQAKMAVWVLSAGPNGIIDTPFAASILTSVRPGGDDIGTRVQ